MIHQITGGCWFDWIWEFTILYDKYISYVSIL